MKWINIIMKLKNTELKNEFLKLTENQLSDYKYLSNFIKDKVGVSLNRRKLKKVGIMPIEDYDKMTCWGGLGAKQYPDELAKFLVFIYRNKDKINSYCEIGVAAGGSFFVIDSFLRAINPNMGKSVAIDTNNKCSESFEIYKKENPSITFLNISSNTFNPTMNYDLCFIDGDHSLKGCTKDYYKMKNFAKYVAFHDIHLPSGGVKDLWKTISTEKIEFLNEDKNFPFPVGIGVIL